MLTAADLEYARKDPEKYAHELLASIDELLKERAEISQLARDYETVMFPHEKVRFIKKLAALAKEDDNG